MSDPDGRWMSYDELGQLRGISRHSAARLVRRHKWPRRADNLTGAVRVLVPHHALTETDSPTDVRPGQNSAIEALRMAVEALRERAAAADARAERAENALAAERSRAADLANALLAVDQARAEAQVARGEAEQLRQADQERRAEGRWTRIRRAWRGG